MNKKLLLPVTVVGEHPEKDFLKVKVKEDEFFIPRSSVIGNENYKTIYLLEYKITNKHNMTNYKTIGSVWNIDTLKLVTKKYTDKIDMLIKMNEDIKYIELKVTEIKVLTKEDY